MIGDFLIKKIEKSKPIFFLIKSLHFVFLESIKGMKNYSLIKILSTPCDRYSDSEYLLDIGQIKIVLARLKYDFISPIYLSKSGFS